MQRRMGLAPYAMRSRRGIVEHPFGIIKSWMGNPDLSMKRLKNVKTEIGLHILAYNMKRVMQILGTGPLMGAIGA
jgi:transposase